MEYQDDKTVMQPECTNNEAPRLHETAFSNKQLCLFQTYFANTDEQIDQISNSIDFWDSVPRFSVSQKAMNKLRDDKGRLDLMQVDFLYKQAKFTAIIQPALIREELNGVESTVAYYPSANEELVEEALRKIASVQGMGVHEEKKLSGVVFTLYQLREELRKRGHDRNYSQVVLSLNILSASMIEITCGDKKSKSFTRSPYFPVLAGVTREDLNASRDAKWYVQFHPLITESLDKLTYRQFNYQQLMSHTTQLARWLHKLIVNKYTFASKVNTFEIRYSTIKRDSAMLNNYTRERKAIEACDLSVSELKDQNIISNIIRETIQGARNKTIDVIYTLTPTNDFIKEVKAANARQGQVKL